MSKDIFVFAEQRDGKLQNVSYELIGEAASLAQDLGQKVVAVLLGDKVKQYVDELIKFGADEVIVVEAPILKEYMTEPYAKALTAVIRDRNPEIFLIGATSIGRDLAPRISARIKTGLTADCTALCIDPDTKLLMMTRPAFGGNLMAIIRCKDHRPQMATVRPGVMQPMEKDLSRTGKVERFQVKFDDRDINIEILEIVKKTKTAADITAAKCLVSGGRGIGNKEYFGELRELAELLDGEISSSRAAVDAGWMDKERQVGQTGKDVYKRQESCPRIRWQLYRRPFCALPFPHLSRLSASDRKTALHSWRLLSRLRCPVRPNILLSPSSYSRVRSVF